MGFERENEFPGRSWVSVCEGGDLEDGKERRVVSMGAVVVKKGQEKACFWAYLIISQCVACIWH